MTEIENRFYKLKEFLAFAISPLGKDQVSDELRSQAQTAIDKIKSEVIEQKKVSNNQIQQLTNELNEYTQFRSLLPLDSQSIRPVNDKITDIAKELESIIEYNVDLYFETYFMLNTISHDVAKASMLNGRTLDSFKRWFEGSKVVDESGQPMIVYHGSGSDFTQFAFDVFPGAYFAENKSYSEWFARAKRGEGQLFEVYLRILNPMDLRLFYVDKVKYEDFVAYIELKYGYVLPENKMLKTMSDQQNGMWVWQYIRMGGEWLKYIQEQGIFDGLMFYENNPGDIINGKENVTPAWLVFKPEQIKSAYANMIYSLESKDIRFKTGGNV